MFVLSSVNFFSALLVSLAVHAPKIEAVVPTFQSFDSSRSPLLADDTNRDDSNPQPSCSRGCGRRNLIGYKYTFVS